MDSLEITSGKRKKPFNIILIGVPGIGKSTFAANAPKPVFLGAEENDELDVSRFPIPKTFDEFVAQLTSLHANPRGFQTVVIDTLDSIEKLLHAKILSMDGKGAKSVMAALGGYGKAYEYAETELAHVRDLLKSLRDSHGMNVILLAHSKKVRATDTIIGMEYDTYEMNLHVRAQNLFVDWVSAVLFANYIAHAREGANSDKVFAMGHGQRVLLTEKRPGHLGKNRYNLPYEMDLDFPEFYAAYEAFYEKPVTAAQLFDQITGLLANIKDQAVVEKVMQTVEKNPTDVPALKKILARVQELVGA